MKPFLATAVVLMLCSSLRCYAQMERFKIDNKKVSWNASYSTLVSQEKLVKQLKLSGNFKQVEAIENKIVARLTDFTLDTRSFVGAAFWGQPTFITTTHWYGFVTLTLEEDTVKVKVSNMYCKYLNETKSNEDGTIKVGSIYNFETLLYSEQRNELSRLLNKDVGKILDGNFNRLIEQQLTLKDLNN